MRSALEDFGTISLATKDVDVYSSDEIDWGVIDPRFRSPQHLTGIHGDGCVVFNSPADFAAIDDFIPFIADSAAPNATTKILTGPQVGALLGAAPKKGIAWVLPLPRVHRRYMRAGATPKSSGTFTASNLKAYNEYGSNIGLGTL